MITRPCSYCNGTGRVIDATYLRNLRLTQGLSLREVARRAGFSVPYISDLELGRRPLRGELGKRLEAAISGESEAQS